MKPNIHHEVPEISHGDGVYLYDIAGKEYLDGASGAVTANIGHGQTEIADVARDQISRVAFSFRTQFSNRPSEELASKILDRAGDKSKAFFLSSGSEANEAAIRLALQYWRESGRPQKRRILSRRISYHGNTLGALSLSSDMRRQEVAELLFDEPIVPACYCYRCPFGKIPETCQIDCAQSLEDAILFAGPENVAAFITEPIIGATGGAVVPHSRYFTRIREICDRHEVLLIADEVISGFGRTGKWFGMHHWDVSADIAILGKGINAGYTPLSAVLVSTEISAAIENGSGSISIGNTHSGNPLSAAICSAVIDFIDNHDLVEQANERGKYLRMSLEKLAKRYPIIGDVRGLGLLFGIEFVRFESSKTPFNRTLRLTERIVDKAFENGLIVYPCRGLINANQGDAILVAPPLIVTENQIDILCNRLETAIKEVYQELGNNNQWSDPA